MKRVVVLCASTMVALLLVACGNSNSANKESSSSEAKSSSLQKSKSESNKKESMKKAKVSSESKASSESAAKESSMVAESSAKAANLVRNELKKGFSFAPIKYNGEDISKAMEEGTAPRHSLFDLITLGYAKSDTVVRAQLGKDRAYNYTYKITDKFIIMRGESGSHRIPYTINGSHITYGEWIEKQSNGTKLTYEFVLETTAEDAIDAQQTQNKI